jgi:hypothetical protein
MFADEDELVLLLISVLFDTRVLALVEDVNALLNSLPEKVAEKGAQPFTMVPTLDLGVWSACRRTELLELTETLPFLP